MVDRGLVTTFIQGQTASLSAEWRVYAGGPLVAVTGVTIGIVNLLTATVALAPTATGVSTPATGINAYGWAVPGALAAGEYLVTWTGTDPQADVVTATEIVTVVASLTTYGTLAALKAMLSIVDTSRDTLLQASLEASREQIDNMTGRSFLPSAVATQRIIKVDRNLTTDGALLIPDVSTLTDLAVETGVPGSWTTLLASSYYAAPENDLALGRPITMLRSAYLTTPWIYQPYVRLTSRPGWPTTPASVTQAGLLLSSRLFARRNSPEGVIGSQDWGGGLRVARTDADVQALLSAYMLPGFA